MLSKGFSQESLPTLQFKSINSSALSFLYSPTLISIHDYWKNHSFDYKDTCQQVMSPLFNMLCRFVIAFLPRSKHLLISWLQSLSAVILEPPKIKSLTVSIISSSICHEVMGTDARSKLIRLVGTMDSGSYSLITGYWSSVGDAERTLQEEGTGVQPLMLVGEGTKEKHF